MVNIGRITHIITLLLLILLTASLLSCNKHEDDNLHYLSEIDTVVYNSSFISSVREYKNKHNKFKSFVIFETMLRYRKGRDYHVFEISPAFSSYFGHSEFSLVNNYPSQYFILDDAVFFVQSLTDDFINQELSKAAYNQYSIDNLDATCWDLIYDYGEYILVDEITGNSIFSRNKDIIRKELQPIVKLQTKFKIPK